MQQVPDKDKVLSETPVSLFEGRLLMKSLEEVSADSWKFKGIASDETPDTTGDEILRKSLDLSYAQARGFVNWDHSRAPEDQLGFLTRVDILSGPQLTELQKSMGVPIADTATVYLEGELYRYVKRAQSVHELLKSSMETGYRGGPGLSLDGVMARDKESGNVVKAFVRGVALSSVPAHTKTLCMLMKSLQGYSDGEKTPVEIQDVADTVELLRKSAGMTTDEAVLWLLKKRPQWTYEFATRVVSYTIQNTKN